MPPTLSSHSSFCSTALTILLSPPSSFHTPSKFFLIRFALRVSPCSTSPFPYRSSLTNMSTLLLLVRPDLLAYPISPTFVLTYISRCHRLEILSRLRHLALLRGCLPLVLCVYDECLPLFFSLIHRFSLQQSSSRPRTAPSRRPQPCSTETKPPRTFKLLPMLDSFKMRLWTRNRLAPTTIKRSKINYSPWFLFHGSTGQR